MTARDIDILIADIRRSFPVQAQIAASDVLALVKNRVVQRGLSADGSRFSAYSDRKVPAFWYLGKSRSAQGEARVRQKVKSREGLSYKEFRKLNNLNTDRKNFEFTGEMWRSTGVREQISGDRVTVKIGGSSDLARKKIEWLSDQEGKLIIEASKAEINLIENRLRDWLRRKVINALQ